MKRVRRFIPVLIIVLVVAAVAVGAYLRFGPQQAKAANVATTPVQRGNLVATVNSAGNIAARQQVALNFGQAGTVQKVHVKVSDRVKTGQVLAETNTADLQLQLENAQVSLRTAQARLAQTKNPTTAQDIANARAKLESAQANFNKVKAGPTAEEMAAAQASVASAQAGYDAALRAVSAPSSQLEQARANLEKAEVNLQKAQADYDKVAWRPDVGRLPQGQALQTATADYNSAKAAFDAVLATAGADQNTKVQQARSQLQGAQSSLVKLQNQPTESELVAAKTQLTQAQNDLDKLLAGPDANALDIAQNSVDQAVISVKQAQLRLDQSRLVAPFDGVVTAVNITLGQNVTTGAAQGAVQLADLDNLEIVVNMAEVDVSKIKVDQAAQVTLDALPDQTLRGRVTLVAPAGVTSQGVVNYPVTVRLDSPPAAVKTGMTANVNIVIDQRNNVLVVPNRALRSQGRQRYVTVLFEGNQMAVQVVAGLSGDTNTEIVSGLKEGDEVVLNTTTTAQSGMGGMPGMPGGGGGAVFFQGR